MDLAVAAFAISVFSAIGLFVNSLFTIKTYRKNKRLEFLQRRDHLSQKISELNARNTECHLISARYEIVAVKNTGLQLQGQQAEQNAVLIAAIRKRREDIEKGIKLSDEAIRQLHFIYSNLTLETDAPEVERIVALIQVASDQLKNTNDVYLSTLHILETTSDLIKTSLAEADAKRRQINLDFERAVEKINVDFEKAVEKLEKEHLAKVQQLNDTPKE